MAMIYNPLEVSGLTTALLKFLETDPSDDGVKIAACRSAAAVIENTVAAQSLAVVVNNVINGGK